MAEKAFLEYLQNYEVHNRIREEFSELPLSTPLLFLPATRTSGDQNLSVSLPFFNDHDYKSSVDATSSRSLSGITKLAIGRMAQRYRNLLEMADGKTKEKFREDPSNKKLTETLSNLGYNWDFQGTDINQNRYEMILEKQGSKFQFSTASSGERELLTYLLAIYALNIKDALVVIDEPELHLHPQWQEVLMWLFEKLAEDSGNQFLMATHSPAFASPGTIKYIARVYSEKNCSRIVNLSCSEPLPSAKHLFNIVNSQNNERVFFSDLVILVEGITDRIFFEALFRHFDKGRKSGRVFEVVSVGGKTFFEPYKRLLSAFKVQFVVISDLDYVCEVGDPSLKTLFRVSAKKLKEKGIESKTSIDASTFITEIDNAIKTADMTALTELWEYMKARHSRLRTDLKSEERARLDEFLSRKKTEGVFILRSGSLEDYLPEGHAGKDLNKLIELVSRSNWWDELPESGKLELKKICEEIPF